MGLCYIVYHHSQRMEFWLSFGWVFDIVHSTSKAQEVIQFHNTLSYTSLPFPPSDIQSIVFLHARFANSSNCGTSTGPLTFSSASPSTTASATASTFNGFVPAAPKNPLNTPPR